MNEKGSQKLTDIHTGRLLIKLQIPNNYSGAHLTAIYDNCLERLASHWKDVMRQK